MILLESLDIPIVDRHICCCDDYNFHPRRCYCGDSHSYLPESTKSCKSLSPNLKIELRFLQTCRQMYREALHVVFKMFVFSFSAPEDLKLFLDTVPATLYIRGIRLDMFVGNGNAPKDWLEAISQTAKSMTQLQELHLDITQLHTNKERLEGLESDVDEVVELLTCLSELPLKTVTVLLTDQQDSDDDGAPDGVSWLLRGRWTMAQKQEWSQKLRRLLLQRPSA